MYGAKVLACRFCTIDMHGRPLLDDRTWTYLGATAEVGATSLTLKDRVDWDVGSAIMITSTAFNGTMEEAETAIVTGVSEDGLTLSLEEPGLLYRHLGETLPLAGGHAVDFRANVGLLTRNVVIQGTSPFSQLDKHGGHVMLHSRGDESLIGRFENIECRYMGQGFRLGRYPIHFHMIGACSC